MKEFNKMTIYKVVKKRINSKSLNKKLKLHQRNVTHRAINLRQLGQS